MFSLVAAVWMARDTAYRVSWYCQSLADDRLSCRGYPVLQQVFAAFCRLSFTAVTPNRGCLAGVQDSTWLSLVESFVKR